MSKTKDSKEFFYGGTGKRANDELMDIKHILRNKYYNLYRSNFKTKGLTYQEENYVFNKLWEQGKIAVFKIKHTDDLGYASWARQTWDMYGEDKNIVLINEWGSPLVPTNVMEIGKDCVIGYIQSNRKPIKMFVEHYVDRLANIQMAINTNLQLQKMPFIIPVERGVEKGKIDDVVQRIINNELVICVDGVNPSIFQSVSTNVPYLCEDLMQLYKNTENELLTYLGINNNGMDKVEQVQMAQVNSNNETINMCDDNFNENLKKLCEQVKEVLGKDISIEVAMPDVVNDGQAHNNDEKTGPKEMGENNDN